MSEGNAGLPGQLRGVGLRLDPQSILIAPESSGGLVWGYTITDKTRHPTIFMNGEWKTFIPQGVWLQMLDNWDTLVEIIKQDPEKYDYYLQYDEIKKDVEQ
jgi:hypothetical protein